MYISDLTNKKIVHYTSLHCYCAAAFLMTTCDSNCIVMEITGLNHVSFQKPHGNEFLLPHTSPVSLLCSTCVQNGVTQHPNLRNQPFFLMKAVPCPLSKWGLLTPVYKAGLSLPFKLFLCHLLMRTRWAWAEWCRLRMFSFSSSFLPLEYGIWVVTVKTGEDQSC